MRTKSRPPPVARQNLSADLNEVKRRFIRQNRELAKNNSSQSLRIRSLEIEVSRLLQTNLELREELLRARNAEHDARRQSNKEGVRGFKEEMMAKLRELSGIVEGIEEPKEEKDDGIAEREERRMSVLSQMEFRERQSLAELMRDCQMPTIDENKMHPRRTLEAAEIKAIRLSDGSSNGSPDLGPPPVARFECPAPCNRQSSRIHCRQALPCIFSLMLILHDHLAAPGFLLSRHAHSKSVMLKARHSVHHALFLSSHLGS